MMRESTREGIASPETGAPAPNTRYHYMDNLRALAMLAGIFFHAALAWSPMLSQLWLSADSESSMVMEAFAWFSHLFRMPLFFLIAGFFACYLVGKRGPWGLLRNRALRIATPFAVFLPLVWTSLAMLVGWATEHVANPSPMLGMIKFFAQMPEAPPPPVTTVHLWFLYVLIQFALVYALLERFGVMRGRWTRLLASVPFVALVLPVLLVPALASVAAPFPAPEQFTPSLWTFGFFGVFFILGAAMFRDPSLLERLRPWAPWLAVVSVGLYAIYFTMLPGPVSMEQAMAGQAFSWRHLGMSVLEAYVSVHMTLVCLVVGQRFLDRANRVMRLVADSSYWVYIVHLPVLFWIQFALLDTDWNIWAQFAVSSFGTLAIGFASYLLLVRWTPIGWLLNGRRKQHATSVPGPLGGTADLEVSEASSRA